MSGLRRSAASSLVVLAVMVVVAGCGGEEVAIQTTHSETPAVTPLRSTGPGMAVTDLSVIGCGTEDPSHAGDLTGGWQGSGGGVYYIRHVGDCVWWFGTEVDDIEPGMTGQPGFANVASGRMAGAQVDLEWVDVPLGDILNGGGLTFFYDQANRRLTLAEQRGGGQAFGDSVLTRIETPASAGASPSSTATP